MSYLVFEAVNVWGFWGPIETQGDKENKNKVVTLIFMKFWSRNNLDKLDRLTPKDNYHKGGSYNMYDIVCSPEKNNSAQRLGQ